MDREDAKVWLAWCEVARHNAGLAEAVAGIAEENRELVASLLPDGCDERDLDVAVAVIDGLTAARCRTVDPLPPARAGAALSRLLLHLAPPSPADG